MAPTIHARKPTGRVAYPMLLVEGQEKAGKSWACAVLSSSPRVGQTYWLDLGEGGADEYGAIPGVRFLVLEHDGSYAQVLDQILAVKAEAARVKAAGEPPVVLVVDSITDLWTGLKAWVDERYRRSPSGQAKLRKDPDAELKPTQNLWNDANSRHRRVMTQLMTFPGIVVVTARGKEVTEVKDGKPVEGGAKVWAVEAQKDVPFDATLWLRMFRDHRPIVVGARSVHAGIRPGEEPQPINEDHENLLDWLIFDILKVDPIGAAVRDMQHVSGGELTDDERAAEQPDEPRQERGARPPQQSRGQSTAGGQETARALALSAARAAAKASGVEDLEKLAEPLPPAVMSVDVSSAITKAQRVAATVHEPRLAAVPQVPLFGWLGACRLSIEKGGTSVADAAAYDEPDDAPAEMATSTA